MDALTAAYLQNCQQLHNYDPTMKKRRRNTKVYIGGLPADATADELFEVFRYFGNLTKIWIAKKPPGFAYAFYEKLEEAQNAVNEMNGKTICGQTIKVEIAYENLPMVVENQKQQLLDAQMQAIADIGAYLPSALPMGPHQFSLLPPASMTALQSPYVCELPSTPEAPRQSVTSSSKMRPTYAGHQNTLMPEWWEKGSSSKRPYPKHSPLYRPPPVSGRMPVPSGERQKTAPNLYPPPMNIHQLALTAPMRTPYGDPFYTSYLLAQGKG